MKYGTSYLNDCIVAAINEAEIATKGHIEEVYNNVNEEFVTTMFCRQVQKYLQNYTVIGKIEAAFAKDLKSALTKCGINIDYDVERKVLSKSKGLVADIVEHNKRREGKSGGDFGVVVIIPHIVINNEVLSINNKEVVGIMCQAKLKQSNYKWRSFTKSQRKVLPDRLEYTALTLYSYKDTDRKLLENIRWRNCEGQTMPALEAELSKDNLTDVVNSNTLFKKLCNKEIGTTDKDAIENYICGKKYPWFELTVGWPTNPQKDVCKVRLPGKKNKNQVLVLALA